MRSYTRPALLASLVLGLTLSLGGAARADHGVDNHPFCAQGGGQEGISSGGEGGTIQDQAAAAHFADTGGESVPETVLVPRHLGERFGEEPLPPGFTDPTAGEQFIEIDADDIGDSGNSSSSGGAFHGGHGGGPGGGQGGSTFFGGGDGGCSPDFRDVTERRRPPGKFVPGRRLPVTGSLAQQLGLMSGLMLSLGWLLSLLGRRRTAVLAAAGSAVEGPAEPARVRRGHEVVSRLKEQVVGSWRAGG